MKKIVITGIGAVTPIGIGVENYWNALLNGECGIEEITKIDTEKLPLKRAAEIKNFKPRDYMTAKLSSDMDPFMQFAYVSAKEAINQAGIEEFDANRTGIVMGTALAGMNTTGETQVNYELKGKHVNPKFLAKVMGNIAAAYLSIEYGIKGPSITVSTACSSGGDAIMTAIMILQSGMADMMIVMGGESAVSPLVINSLTLSGALSKTGSSRPFDVNRNGFVIGEGGGAIILETEEHAKKRNAKIIATLLGCANNTDAYNPVAPAPDGSGAAECMKIAINNAGICADDIGYINAHGTATLKGDIAETTAIRNVFGDRDVLVSSTKGATGHLMGAGGITECIACIKAIETGIIPPTVNCDEVDPECNANIVTKEPKKADISVAMSNALGFGGQNSSIIVGRYEG